MLSMPAPLANAAPRRDASAEALLGQGNDAVTARALPASPSVGRNAAMASPLRDGGDPSGAGQFTPSQGGIAVSVSPPVHSRDRQSRWSVSSSIVDESQSPGTARTIASHRHSGASGASTQFSTPSRSRGHSGYSDLGGGILSRRSSMDRAADVASHASRANTEYSLPSADGTLPATASQRRAAPLWAGSWTSSGNRPPGYSSPTLDAGDDALWRGSETGAGPAEMDRLDRCGDGELSFLVSRPSVGTTTATASANRAAVAVAAATISPAYRTCMPAVVEEEEQQQQLHPPASVGSSFPSSAGSSLSSSPTPASGCDASPAHASPRGPLPPSVKKGAFSPQRPSRATRKSAGRDRDGAAAGATPACEATALHPSPALCGERCENPMSSAIAGESSLPSTPVPVNQESADAASGHTPPELSLGASHDEAESPPRRGLTHDSDQLQQCPVGDQSRCNLFRAPNARVSGLYSVQEAASQEEDEEEDEVEGADRDVAPASGETPSGQEIMDHLRHLRLPWNARTAGVDRVGHWPAQSGTGSGRLGRRVNSAVGSDTCDSLASVDMGGSDGSPRSRGDRRDSLASDHSDGAPLECHPVQLGDYDTSACHGFGSPQHDRLLSPNVELGAPYPSEGAEAAPCADAAAAPPRVMTVNAVSSSHAHSSNVGESARGGRGSGGRGGQGAYIRPGGPLISLDAATQGGAEGDRLQALLGEEGAEEVRWRASQQMPGPCAVEEEQQEQGGGEVLLEAPLHRGLPGCGAAAQAQSLECVRDRVSSEEAPEDGSTCLASPLIGDAGPRPEAGLGPAGRGVALRRERRRAGSTRAQRVGSRPSLKRSRSITHAELNLDQEGVDPEFDADAAAYESAALEQQGTPAVPHGLARPMPSLASGPRIGAASASQAVSSAAAAAQRGAVFDGADALGSAAEASARGARAGHRSVRPRAPEFGLARRTRRRSVSGTMGVSPVMRPRARSARQGEGEGSAFFQGAIPSPHTTPAAPFGQSTPPGAEKVAFALGTPRRAASRASFAFVLAARRRSVSATVGSASAAQGRGSPGARPRSGLPRLVVPSPTHVR